MEIKQSVTMRNSSEYVPDIIGHMEIGETEKKENKKMFTKFKRDMDK